jgi:hypothetical protein
MVLSLDSDGQGVGGAPGARVLAAERDGLCNRKIGRGYGHLQMGAIDEGCCTGRSIPECHCVREKSGACDREVQIAVANSDGTLIGIGKSCRCVGGCLRRKYEWPADQDHLRRLRRRSVGHQRRREVPVWVRTTAATQRAKKEKKSNLPKAESCAAQVLQSNKSFAGQPVGTCIWGQANNGPLALYRNLIPVSSSQICHNWVAVAVSFACGANFAGPTSSPRISWKPCGP